MSLPLFPHSGRVLAAATRQLTAPDRTVENPFQVLLGDRNGPSLVSSVVSAVRRLSSGPLGVRSTFPGLSFVNLLCEV
jgi:hypothetical protein